MRRAFAYCSPACTNCTLPPDVALRKDGLEDHAQELRQRGMDAPSWADMMTLIGKYLDVEIAPCRWGRG